jgi:hypothetical protein
MSVSCVQVAFLETEIFATHGAAKLGFRGETRSKVLAAVRPGIRGDPTQEVLA